MFCVCEWVRNEGVFVCERVSESESERRKKGKEIEFKHLGRKPVYIKPVQAFKRCKANYPNRTLQIFLKNLVIPFTPF